MSARWPEIGGRYRSRDRRDAGLVVTVLDVNLDAGFVVIQRFRKTKVALHRFRRDYIGPIDELEVAAGKDTAA